MLYNITNYNKRYNNMQDYRYDGSKRFNIKSFDCSDTGEFKDRAEVIQEFVTNLEQINEYQQKLFAEGKEGIIFVFQAMDAAGKDGAVRACLSCLSPQGVAEHSFKVPSAEEGRHDYLWRFWKALPEKGCISILNRSYYEDVLVQRVHDYYKNYKWADRIDQSKLIGQRYDQIKNFEKYLWENSYRVVKIFLNVSKEEQARRFISRIDTQKKNWKFSSSDVEEREYWDEYMKAYEICINKTAKENTPWYVIPADHKWYARLCISRIILKELKIMNPQWPTVSEDEFAKFSQYRAKLALETELNEEEEAGKKVKPADTAISMAYKASRKATSEKKLRKKLSKYLKEKLEDNNVQFEETFAALEEAYLDKEELQAAAEFENANKLNDVYQQHKENIKNALKGYGKEANKIYNRFKADAKQCIETYSQTVDAFYNEYENGLIDNVKVYEDDINENGVEQPTAFQQFIEKLEEAYQVNRENAEKIYQQSVEDLQHFADKYSEIADIFRSTNKLLKKEEEPVEEEKAE